MSIEENDLIVVHTGESKSIQFNPATNVCILPEFIEAGGVIISVITKEEYEAISKVREEQGVAPLLILTFKE